MPRMTSLSKLAIAFGLGVGVAIGGQALVTRAVAGQPFMDAALEQLRGARASLVQAEPNKGGHRDAAIGLIDQAIEQVKMGIAFAR
ncbi:hypothetical protein [Aquabacter spiritensis]|uniref:Uncharacterized protein n=1 Tax=Aquabacter spiritensis TaxID=933073 RepID=A0A4R3M0N7_9HYPH|nr:hypothetical protein [Aquabacter spiritensis]TCT04657.1 hypothetical protein EDC64_10689 [Aquabacter spiritensis]